MSSFFKVILGCFSSSAAAEPPAPEPAAPEPAAPEPAIPVVAAVSARAIGDSGARAALQAGRFESAADVRSQDGAGAAQRPKKSVGFNENMNQSKVVGPCDSRGRVNGKKTAESDVSKMRRLVWTLRYWDQTFNAQNSLRHRDGRKALEALLEKIRSAHGVQQALKILSDSAMLSRSNQVNPTAEMTLPRGLVFSGLEVRRLGELQEGFSKLLEQLKPEIKAAQYRSAVVYRTTPACQMEKLALPQHPPLLGLQLSETGSPAKEPTPETWSLSIRGDQTEALPEQVSVLFWAELFRQLQEIPSHGVPGLDRLELHDSFEVTILKDAKPKKNSGSRPETVPRSPRAPRLPVLEQTPTIDHRKSDIGNQISI